MAKRLCVVCLEKPARTGASPICQGCWQRLIVAKVSHWSWAAARARSYERRRWQKAIQELLDHEEMDVDVAVLLNNLVRSRQ